MIYQSRQNVTAASLGDLSALKTIISNVQAIAETGDFVAAEKRVTDFETAWDDKESSLRKLNPDAWGNIDDAADAVFKALRASTPVAADVKATLANLTAVLNNPGAGSDANQPGSASMVNGIAVTDTSGHAIPCEEMITKLKDASAKAKPSAGDKVSADDFLAKAIERCNADDDARADAFSAQGLALTQ
jgi:hypothetical protein